MPRRQCRIQRVEYTVAQSAFQTAEKIILIGDSDFFDDSGYLTEADNSKLIQNWAWIDPALTP